MPQESNSLALIDNKNWQGFDVLPHLPFPCRPTIKKVSKKSKIGSMGDVTPRAPFVVRASPVRGHAASACFFWYWRTKKAAIRPVCVPS